MLLASNTQPTAAQTKEFNINLSETTHRYFTCLRDEAVDDAVNWLTRALAACKQAETAQAQFAAEDMAAAVKAKRLLEEMSSLRTGIFEDKPTMSVDPADHVSLAA